MKNTVGELCKDKSPKDIAKLRILDPACGSGSFLIGALEYLFNYHRDWYVENLLPEADSKGAIPSKVLTKLVPQPPLSGKKRGRRPRQNPIYQGRGGQWYLTTQEKKRILLKNIYGVDIDPQAVEVTKLSLLLKVLEDENQESLRRQMRLFRDRALPDLGANIKCGNSLIGPDFYEGKQLDLFDDEERDRINAFDWNAEFPDILGTTKRGKGFDAVIGNPPYLNIEHMPDSDRVFYSRSYRSFIKRFDTYGLFVEKSTFLLKTGGRFGMIIPSTMLNNLSFALLRKLLLESTRIISIMNLGGRVFHGVNNDTLILIFAHGLGKSVKTQVFDVTNYGAGLATAEFICEKQLRNTCAPPQYIFELRLTDALAQILSKMQASHVRVSDICSCFQGFVTGGNDAYIVRPETIRNERLEKTVCKPAVFGDNISRYGQPRVEDFVIYLDRYSSLSDFPQIRKHLTPFKAKLQRKREVRLGRQPWYSLHWPRVQGNFDRAPKILVQAIRNLSLRKRIVATLDTQGVYADHTLNVLYTDQGQFAIEFILGILNSSLVNVIFAKKYIDINIKGVYLHDIPLPRMNLNEHADKARHDSMVELVERMLDLHKRLRKAKTPQTKTRLEREIKYTDNEIDKLVYELYDLTDQEISIVEEATA